MHGRFSRITAVKNSESKHFSIFNLQNGISAAKIVLTPKPIKHSFGWWCPKDHIQKTIISLIYCRSAQKIASGTHLLRCVKHKKGNSNFQTSTLSPPNQTVVQVSFILKNVSITAEDAFLLYFFWLDLMFPIKDSCPVKMRLGCRYIYERRSREFFIVDYLYYTRSL